MVTKGAVIETKLTSFLDFGSDGSSFLCGLFKGRLGLDALVEVEFGVGVTAAGDQTLTCEVADESTRDGTIDLEFFAKDSASDAKNLLALGGDLVVPPLVEEDFIVKLVLDLNLGPALLI